MTRPPHLVIPDPDREPTPASFWPLIRNPLSHRHPGPRAGTHGQGAATIIPHTHTLPPSCPRRNVPPYPETGPVPRGAARLPPQPSSPTNTPSPLTVTRPPSRYPWAGRGNHHPTHPHPLNRSPRLRCDTPTHYPPTPAIAPKTPFPEGEGRGKGPPPSCRRRNVTPYPGARLRSRTKGFDLVRPRRHEYQERP